MKSLGSNTQLIVALALLSGAAAFVATPIGAPFVTRLSRRLLLSLLARRHGVRCGPGTLDLLAGSPGSTAAALRAVVEAGTRRSSMLRTLVPWLLRVQDVRHTFALGLFFDRYLGHHRRGSALDAQEAARLRRAIDEAAPVAFRSALGGVLLYGLGQATEAAMAMPRALWRLMWAALGKEQGDALDEVERVVEQDVGGLFSKAARLIEDQLREATKAAISAFWRPFDAALGVREHQAL